MRVLVVEDLLLLAMSLERALQSWGHQVELRHSVEDAVECAARWKPELVLMDIDLGTSRDGIDAMLAIQEALGPVPHIYLTGFDPKETQGRTAQTGPDGYLEKPVCPEDLRLIIDSLRPG